MDSDGYVIRMHKRQRPRYSSRYVLADAQVCREPRKDNVQRGRGKHILRLCRFKELIHILSKVNVL